MSIAFDRMEFVKALKGSSVSDEQAVDIAEALKKAQDPNVEELVTKDQLDARLSEMENRLTMRMLAVAGLIIAALKLLQIVP
ncbi:MAG: hypothetical protein HQL54_07565 [Magnetococcales bacterium]|nr:hypothetical protein [Magnetococcales bacterium]